MLLLISIWTNKSCNNIREMRMSFCLVLMKNDNNNNKVSRLLINYFRKSMWNIEWNVEQLEQNVFDAVKAIEH